MFNFILYQIAVEELTKKSAATHAARLNCHRGVEKQSETANRVSFIQHDKLPAGVIHPHTQEAALFSLSSPRPLER
jgi:hypothetical protein